MNQLFEITQMSILDNHSIKFYIVVRDNPIQGGPFFRAPRLPDTVDHEKAESKYENGVVTVTFPKKESKKASTISVETSQLTSRQCLVNRRGRRPPRPRS